MIVKTRSLTDHQLQKPSKAFPHHDNNQYNSLLCHDLPKYSLEQGIPKTIPIVLFDQYYE